MEQMDIVIVEPGKKPRRVTIEHTLKNLQEIVGGSIQAIYPWDDDNENRLVGLVCNDDGIALGLPFNRYIEEQGYGPIWGTFFLCGLSEEDFTSLTEEDAKFLMKRFDAIEDFTIIGGTPVVFRRI